MHHCNVHVLLHLISNTNMKQYDTSPYFVYVVSVHSGRLGPHQQLQLYQTYHVQLLTRISHDVLAVIACPSYHHNIVQVPEDVVAGAD